MKRHLASTAVAFTLFVGAAHAQPGAGLGFGSGSSTAPGQPGAVPADTKLEPPGFNVTTGSSGVGFIPMVVGFLFMGLVLGVNLIPTKRGHQD